MNVTSGELRRTRAALVLALGLAFAAPAYAAPPSAGDVGTARELYKQGADALDAGDAKTAAARLTAAWSLVQTPVIGFDLARAQLALGHLVEAREAALAVTRVPVASDETGRTTKARADADHLAATIAPRIPHVRLAVTGVSPDRHFTVKLDGAEIPSAALAIARQTNPGSHTATVDVDDGRHAEGSVVLAEGENKELQLTVPAPKPGDTPPPPVAVTPPPTSTVTPPPVAPPPSTASTSSTSPLVWVGLGVGGVGLAVGAISGAFALSEASTVRNNCKLVVAGENVCPTAYAGDLSAANTLSVVSTVGFIGAGVGLAVMITGFFLGGKHTEKTAVLYPLVGPGSLGLAGTFQ